MSDRLDDETLALSYLYLRDEYGAGELDGRAAPESLGAPSMKQSFKPIRSQSTCWR